MRMPAQHCDYITGTEGQRGRGAEASRNDQGAVARTGIGSTWGGIRGHPNLCSGHLIFGS